MFFISISNGILTKEHRQKLGAAIWEFIWCLDKITRIDSRGWGYVLGGKPVNLKDIAHDLGTDTETTSRNLIKLEKEGYISKRRVPYGMVIWVMKAKKRFGKKVESRPGFVDSRPGNVESRRKNVESNIDSISMTNTFDISNDKQKKDTPLKEAKRHGPQTLQEGMGRLVEELGLKIAL